MYGRSGCRVWRQSFASLRDLNCIGGTSGPVTTKWPLRTGPSSKTPGEMSYEAPGIPRDHERVAAGGLMSYGPSILELLRMTTSYISRTSKVEGK